MPVSEVPGFRTSDGTLFDDKQTAEEHELKLELREWYNSNYLSSDYSRVDFDDMLDWLITNATQVRKILRVMI